ncbi:uncharacterized protein LOC143236214 [Tachypleus tridentatus]|uniref:uncharacterized protein LOC143236214 n=1 Tax=Tachypleus tridentatus TaxID=6853 RepID=UPI003FD26B6A
MQTWCRGSDIVRPNIRMETMRDLRNFDPGMIAGASIPKTADILEFSSTTVSKVYREWRKTQKYSEWQFCGRKHLVNDCLMKEVRLFQADMKATNTQVITLNNSTITKDISESTTHRVLKWMGYSS